MRLNEPINQLLSLGLTEYESRGYLAMLEKQSSTASDLAKLSGIPRTRIYDILEKLAQSGMCIELLGKEKKYQAVAPDIALQRLLEHQKAEFVIKEKLVGNLSSSLKEKYQQGLSNDNPLDYIELLRDPRHMAARVMHLVASAKKEILVFVKPPFTNPKKALERQNDESIKAAENKIDCRALYEIVDDREERQWMFGQIDRSVRSGEKARIIEKLPIKMVVVDECKVVFAMEDYHKIRHQQTSLLIEHHALAQSLKILFESLWQNGRDYHELIK